MATKPNAPPCSKRYIKVRIIKIYNILYSYFSLSFHILLLYFFLLHCFQKLKNWDGPTDRPGGLQRRTNGALNFQSRSQLIFLSFITFSYVKGLQMGNWYFVRISFFYFFFLIIQRTLVLLSSIRRWKTCVYTKEISEFSIYFFLWFGFFGSPFLFNCVVLKKNEFNGYLTWCAAAAVMCLRYCLQVIVFQRDFSLSLCIQFTL